MDIEAIRAFITVSETGSFSLAADKLHLTQPAVSKRIALLENQMGARLFDRIGRTVNLTEAGRELEHRARRILIEVEDTRRAIRNLSGEVSGNLSLATSHHIGLWRLPAPLKSYAKQHPAVSFDLHFMDSEVAHEQILHGNLELAIIMLAPSGHERLTSIPVWRDVLTFVCAPDHPLAGEASVTLETLSEHPAILPDMSTFTGRIVKRLFDNHGLPLHIGMSTNYLETIKMLISIGLGWSVLPHTMLDDNTCALATPDIEIDRTLGVIHHRQRTLSNAGKAFIALLLEQSDFPTTDP
ncbi:MAG: LysR family transcriptional regulator [Pseudomonadales bacterium]|nr:LysR family transcriptional regulator [Pseudomonadales bacterium]